MLRAARGDTFLIFEKGEVHYAFYLFDKGKAWNGSQYCVPSYKITKTLSTKNGLRLGMSERETQTILGRPTKIKGDSRRYYYIAHRLLPNGPKGTAELVTFTAFGTISLTFQQHRLTYLAVTRSETD
ncbi:MAG TPA: hypothetical protein VNU00_08920 [Candidatus Binataceae bacterium]|jgi:hypothetical protein|nr:hypothetical protein [Candidatus Binataceae bacterium]